MSPSTAAVTALRAREDLDVEDLRDRFLDHLGQALNSLEAARTDFELLRADRGGDPRFASSSIAGDDVEAFLIAAARPVRASYALAVAAIEDQLPRRPRSKPAVVRR